MREFNQLELAIRWNRLDLAEEYLFEGKDFSMEQLNELLWIALEHKNVNFASSILGKGANLKRYLTEKRFWAYLNSKKHLEKSPLRKLMKAHVSVSLSNNIRFWFDNLSIRRDQLLSELPLALAIKVQVMFFLDMNLNDDLTSSTIVELSEPMKCPISNGYYTLASTPFLIRNYFHAQFLLSTVYFGNR